MSVFSKILMSRKAAKEHKAKLAEKSRPTSEPVKMPYRHVPTHAAVDALSGAPSTWQVEDKGKIREHHKRRSAMTSRAPSYISNVSYMNAAAGPSSAPALPRTNSYNSYNPTWYDRGGDVYHGTEPAHKRFRSSRGHSYNDSGIGPSPLASNLHSEDVSPINSSKNSTTSHSSDHLEMANNQQYRMSQRPQPNVYAEKDIFDRLHTSTTRKLGEAPISNTPPAPRVVTPTAAVQPQAKAKKQRWSILGKRQSVPA